ncbi:MAG: ABC transporter permease [Ignavibacteria bacterium]|nr:MAG: ABC transporter permease [Ignavibacteria bacterium]
MLKQAFAIFWKDLASELRTRYAINALLMFVVVTLAVIMFALVGETLSPGALTGMLWVVMFFAAMSGLSRSFVAEEERGTSMTLQLLATPTAIYLGKLLFNLLLVLALNIFIVLLFLLTMDQFTVAQIDLFWFVILLGSIGIASATTIIAAIIAKANTKGTLFPVLSFPVILPLLMAGISATKIAVEEPMWDTVWPDLQLLGSYIVVVITISFLLFEFVWKD